MRNRKFDRSQLCIYPLRLRKHKMTLADIKTLNMESNYVHPDLDTIARHIADSVKYGSQVILMMGAHPLRRGNSRFFIDLLRRGYITHVATNAAVAIHDFELSFIGATLEDVEFYIQEGEFGHWEETGRYINEAIVRGYRDGLGFGQAIGRMILREECARMPHKDISIFAEAFRLGVPITVHKGIGHDITDQHPSADFAAIGKTSGDDFLIFANSVAGLENGVFLNIGSAVTGPEVYLKALSMARNVASRRGEAIRRFTTAVFDLFNLGDWRNEEGITDFRKPGALQDQRYYFRPLKSILIRTVKDGGQSFYICGDFAETIPALYARVIGAAL